MPRADSRSTAPARRSRLVAGHGAGAEESNLKPLERPTSSPPTSLARAHSTTQRYRVEGIPPDALDDCWPEVVMMLAAALARGLDHTSLGDVRAALEDQSAMLWVVREEDEAAAALVSYIRRSALVVWLLGGRDMEEWAPDVSPLLARYARENDLERVEAYVRPGMTRLLRGLGWRHHQDVVHLEV